ncbi:MAG TPA: NAD(P)-dependent oxidoreductase [Actinomycetota bacterium]
MAERLAFIGLGTMGAPMAGHLAAAGRQVTVYNRTRARAERWAARHGGRVADSPAEAARGAAIVFACVGADEDVREVALGPAGALSSMSPGSVFVDHTTTSAAVARAVASEAAGRGLGFVDAPVSGGQSGAEQGVLTVMAGGDPEHFERVRPAIGCYARCVRLLGPSGSGQLAKMVNQICVAGLVEALAEGLHFARHVGLDVPAVIDVISKGAAQSWQMEHRAPTMHEGRYDFGGFAVDWMRKDLGIALAEARARGLDLPVTALVDGLYAEVQALGGGRWDTSSLLRRLEAALERDE